ncbi:MAG: hypothetical protein ACLFWL_12365 [Candidatus Brocadiia bacterium]
MIHKRYILLLLVFCFTTGGAMGNSEVRLSPSLNETDLSEDQYAGFVDDILEAMRMEDREGLLGLMHPTCRENGDPANEIVKAYLDFLLIRPAPKRGDEVTYQARNLTEERKKELGRITNTRFFPPDEAEYLFFVQFPYPSEAKRPVSEKSFAATIEDGELYLVALDNNVVQMYLQKAEREETKPDYTFHTTTEITRGKGSVMVNGFLVADNAGQEGSSYNASTDITPFLQQGRNTVTIDFHPVVGPHDHDRVALESVAYKHVREERPEDKVIGQWMSKLQSYRLGDMVADGDENEAIRQFIGEESKDHLISAHVLEIPIFGNPVLLQFEEFEGPEKAPLDVHFTRRETDQKLVVEKTQLFYDEETGKHSVPLLDIQEVEYDISGKNAPVAKNVYIMTSKNERIDLLEGGKAVVPFEKIESVLPEWFDHIELRISGKKDIAAHGAAFKDVSITVFTTFKKQRSFYLDQELNMPWTRGELFDEVTEEMKKSLRRQVERIHAAMAEKRASEAANLMSGKAEAVSVLMGISEEESKQQLIRHLSGLMDSEHWAIKPLPDRMRFKLVNNRVIRAESKDGKPLIKGEEKVEGPDKFAAGKGEIDMELFFSKLDGEWIIVW